MEKGVSLTMKSLMRLMPEENKQSIDNYLSSMDLTKATTPNFEEQYNLWYETSPRNIENEILRKYTTKLYYKLMNAILRNRVNYEEHGIVLEETKSDYIKICEKVSDIIRNFPPTTSSFITYRGTDLKEFYEYGIYSIEELETMKGKFLYEKAFTSTSISRESSFYQTQRSTGFKNIEIKFLIPENSQDGIPLLNEENSYCTEEQEYLIDCGSLSKVLDVKVSDDKRFAALTVALIPKRIWNAIEEEKDNQDNKTI